MQLRNKDNISAGIYAAPKTNSVSPDRLTRLARDYVGNLPIYVTENGMANADADAVEDGAVSDGIREDYLFAPLAATKRAIEQGANVKGFFHWSLLNNYDWAEDYGKRFGLGHVDFETQKRNPKASCHAYARALAEMTEGALRTPRGYFRLDE
jgi:beta-glucosidase